MLQISYPSDGYETFIYLNRGRIAMSYNVNNLHLIYIRIYIF